MEGNQTEKWLWNVTRRCFTDGKYTWNFSRYFTSCASRATCFQSNILSEQHSLNAPCFQSNNLSMHRASRAPCFQSTVSRYHPFVDFFRSFSEGEDRLSDFAIKKALNQIPTRHGLRGRGYGRQKTREGRDVQMQR